MVCVFARKTGGPLTSLVKSIDSEIAKNKNLKAFVVLMTDDPDKTAASLKELAAGGGVKSVPLTLVADPKGPGDYEIATDADVTVMMWKQHTVKFNHAYKPGDFTDADVKTVVSDVSKLLGD